MYRLGQHALFVIAFEQLQRDVHKGCCEAGNFLHVARKECTRKQQLTRGDVIFLSLCAFPQFTHNTECFGIYQGKKKRL